MYGISEQFLRKFGGHGIAREEMGCLFRGRADLPPFVEGLGWETKSNGTHWRVVIAGPKKGSPYAKGLFLFDITFPQDYPATAPHITCLTKVSHPSISEDGELQLDALDAGWSPELPAMPRVFSALAGMFAAPDDLALERTFSKFSIRSYASSQRTPSVFSTGSTASAKLKLKSLMHQLSPVRVLGDRIDRARADKTPREWTRKYATQAAIDSTYNSSREWMRRGRTVKDTRGSVWLR